MYMVLYRAFWAIHVHLCFLLGVKLERNYVLIHRLKEYQFPKIPIKYSGFKLSGMLTIAILQTT